MSHYTTELRFVCEEYAGLTESTGYSNMADVIEKARPKIFDFDFPIFDESYRSVLETKIIKHYYTREIGAETVGLWKHFLDRKMNEIMPYYNQLYASEKIKFDPMQDTDYTVKTDRNIKHDEDTSHDDTRTDDLQNITTYTEKNLRTDNLSQLRTDNLDSLRTDNTKSNTKSSDDTSSKDAYSDTPQGVLSGVENNTYLTNYRKVDGTDDYDGTTTNTGTVDRKDTGTQKIDNTGTQTNDRTGNTQSNDTGTQRNAGSGTRDYTNIDDYLEHVAGKRSTASYSKFLQEFRDTFLNIDMDIINELRPLFMNIW